MAEWLTIEVFDAEGFPASLWRDTRGNDLVEASVTHGGLYWEWHETRWGVVLELVFPDDETLERYRDLPAVRAALDAVPDRVHGLLVHRGRGGGAGASVPRRPQPRPVPGAAPWPPRTGPSWPSSTAGSTGHARCSPQAAASRRARAAVTTAGATAWAMRA